MTDTVPIKQRWFEIEMDGDDSPQTDLFLSESQALEVAQEMSERWPEHTFRVVEIQVETNVRVVKEFTPNPQETH